MIVGLAALAAFILAVVPWLAPLAYPLRLLITIVHELGHGLAALLTGGQFLRFVVFPSGEGVAYTAGGWRLLVIPAGYLGAAAFGAGLIVAGRTARTSRAVMTGLGGALLALTLLYGTPSIFSPSWQSGLLTVGSGVFLGAAFLWVAARATLGWTLFLLNLIAVQAGLTAFSDLVTLIGLSTRFFGGPSNDAQAMAAATFLPAAFWAVLWAATAIALIGGALWATWVRPGR
jgi:hypothetical protein